MKIIITVLSLLLVTIGLYKVAIYAGYDPVREYKINTIFSELNPDSVDILCDSGTCEVEVNKNQKYFAFSFSLISDLEKKVSLINMISVNWTESKKQCKKLFAREDDIWCEI